MDNLKTDYLLDNGHLKFTLEGRLDTMSSPELMKIYQEIIDKNDVSKITIDMDNLEYISSNGLRILLMMVKNVGEGNVILKNVNDIISEILETSGFSDILTIDKE